MNDERSARPVSGEIMTDGKSVSPATADRDTGGADIVEAEFETITAETPAGSRSSSVTRRPAPAPNGGLDMLRSGGEAPRKFLSERGGPIFWTFGAILVFAAFWVSGGHAVMRGIPAVPILRADKSALRIASVESRVETRGDRAALFVDGHVVNDGDAVRALPLLSIKVLGTDGTTTRYFLGTNDRALEPGERFTFSSRLLAPKDGVKSVSVTFEEK